jgi:protein-S-isoprenylcysteine O-methyltransferase Ste14
MITARDTPEGSQGQDTEVPEPAVRHRYQADRVSREATMKTSPSMNTSASGSNAFSLSTPLGVLAVLVVVLLLVLILCAAVLIWQNMGVNSL